MQYGIFQNVQKEQQKMICFDKSNQQEEIDLLKEIICQQTKVLAAAAYLFKSAELRLASDDPNAKDWTSWYNTKDTWLVALEEIKDKMLEYSRKYE